MARATAPQAVLDAYGLEALAFGPGYILPKPLDARLKDVIPPAVARAALDSGVASGDWPEGYPPR